MVTKAEGVREARQEGIDEEIAHIERDIAWKQRAIRKFTTDIQEYKTIIHDLKALRKVGRELNG